MCCSVLQFVAVYCSLLQFVAVCCSKFFVALTGVMLSYAGAFVAVCGSVLPRVAVSRSVLQCVVVCCSVCGAVVCCSNFESL